ncbi:MAG: four helix bundle protein, partial [Candidatus Hydrogenedentes bacterium]|nr:four helix bundle protein [Candidatus Hydrogenedentota bacterium]
KRLVACGWWPVACGWWLAACGMKPVAFGSVQNGSGVVRIGSPNFDQHHSTMKNFKKLEVWQLGMDIIDVVFDLYEDLPYSKVAELKGQSTRAAISITSNIAEGSSRRTEKDKLRFMEIALGSSFELETQTLVLQRRPWAPKEKVEELLMLIEHHQIKLMAFIKKFTL